MGWPITNGPPSHCLVTVMLGAVMTVLDIRRGCLDRVTGQSASVAVATTVLVNGPQPLPEEA